MKSSSQIGFQRTIVLFSLMLSVFVGISYAATQIFDPHQFDYAAYWQAGRMILDGKDIYDTNQWLAERAFWGTALHSEPTFQYPLPFAMLAAPFSLLPVSQAYAIWIFISQVFILLALYILLRSFSNQTPLNELAIIAAILMFRPTFIVIFSGQNLSWLLMALSLSILSYHRGKWFIGGTFLALVSLKPSAGLSLLVLIGAWLFIQRRWTALAGLIAGGMALFVLGVMYDPAWVLRYLTIGQYSIQKYYGMQATLWGLSGVLFSPPWNYWGGVVLVLALVASTLYIIIKTRSVDPFTTIATLIPVALLVSPYSWSYDQLMLIIPAAYIAIQLSKKANPIVFFGFLLSLVLIPFGFVLLAYRLGYDVWSLLASAFILGGMVYFYRQKASSQAS